MRLWAIPGNHDTDAYEIRRRTVARKMQIPPYQKNNSGGVPVFLPEYGEWRNAQCRAIRLVQRGSSRPFPRDQEVLMVAHHPRFSISGKKPGVKRILADAFRGTRIRSLVASGHGHWFADQLSVHKWHPLCSDGGYYRPSQASRMDFAPGYTVLALQNGRVISTNFPITERGRIQRSNPLLVKMTPTPVKWPFDGIAYPAEIFEEGFYDRTDHLVSFNGVDVGCHFVFCKSITFRVKPSKYSGKVDSFRLAAYISPSLQPIPTCSFSITGTNGSWSCYSVSGRQGPRSLQRSDSTRISERRRLVYQGGNGAHQLFRGLQSLWLGFGSHKDRLTEYEKWISRRYRTIAATPETVPDAITPQSSHSNIVNFRIQSSDRILRSPGPIRDAAISHLVRLAFPNTRRANDKSRACGLPDGPRIPDPESTTMSKSPRICWIGLRSTTNAWSCRRWSQAGRRWFSHCRFTPIQTASAGLESSARNRSTEHSTNGNHRLQ